jgi:hypothetical protein
MPTRLANVPGRRGAGASKPRSSTFGATAEACLTQIGRQPTPARARFEGLQPHQSLDAVQSARYAVGGKIML